jgi:hypothetical protein
LTKKPLKAFVIRGGLCISRKCGGDLGEIDGSQMDDADDQIDNAIETSSVPVKMMVKHFCKVPGIKKGGFTELTSPVDKLTLLINAL